MGLSAWCHACSRVYARMQHAPARAQLTLGFQQRVSGRPQCFITSIARCRCHPRSGEDPICSCNMEHASAICVGAQRARMPARTDLLTAVGLKTRCDLLWRGALRMCAACTGRGKLRKCLSCACTCSASGHGQPGVALLPRLREDAVVMPQTSLRAIGPSQRFCLSVQTPRGMR